MQRFYSPSTGGFYSDFFNGARQIEGTLTKAEVKAGKRAPMIDNPNCTLPADVVEISEARFAELMQAQADGLQITAIGKKPVAVERVPDAAALAAVRRRQRDRLLAASDWTQVADAPLDALEKKAWADYRQQLRDLDMTGTDWPEQPGAEAA